MKSRLKLLKALGGFPKATNVDFYGNEYGKMLDERFVNVAKIPRVVMVGNLNHKIDRRFKTSQSVFSYTNYGLGLNIIKKETQDYFEISNLYLRNTYKYPIFKVWFSLPKGKNIEFNISSVGADDNPGLTIFKHFSENPNKAIQEIIRGYPGKMDEKVTKMPVLSFNGLQEENSICAEVELTPFATYFRINGVEVSKSKITIDNQQRLVISLIPTNIEDVLVEKPAYLKRITVENKYKKSII